jgi:hypothetical protein
LKGQKPFAKGKKKFLEEKISLNGQKCFQRGEIKFKRAKLVLQRFLRSLRGNDTSPRRPVPSEAVATWLPGTGFGTEPPIPAPTSRCQVKSGTYR